MARKERVSKGKVMRPNYFVFCEGETEVAYTEMLRQHYRLPIHIIAKKTLQNITSALVERCKAVCEASGRLGIRRPRTKYLVVEKANLGYAKCNNILVDGISFIEKLSFNAFNEGTRLQHCVKMHKRLFGVDVKKIGGVAKCHKEFQDGVLIRELQINYV